MAEPNNQTTSTVTIMVNETMHDRELSTLGDHFYYNLFRFMYSYHMFEAMENLLIISVMYLGLKAFAFLYKMLMICVTADGKRLHHIRSYFFNVRPLFDHFLLDYFFHGIPWWMDQILHHLAHYFTSHMRYCVFRQENVVRPRTKWWQSFRHFRKAFVMYLKCLILLGRMGQTATTQHLIDVEKRKMARKGNWQFLSIYRQGYAKKVEEPPGETYLPTIRVALVNGPDSNRVIVRALISTTAICSMITEGIAKKLQVRPRRIWPVPIRDPTRVNSAGQVFAHETTSLRMESLDDPSVSHQVELFIRPKRFFSIFSNVLSDEVKSLLSDMEPQMLEREEKALEDSKNDPCKLNKVDLILGQDLLNQVVFNGTAPQLIYLDGHKLALLRTQYGPSVFGLYEPNPNKETIHDNESIVNDDNDQSDKPLELEKSLVEAKPLPWHRYRPISLLRTAMQFSLALFPISLALPWQTYFLIFYVALTFICTAIGIVCKVCVYIGMALIKTMMPVERATAIRTKATHLKQTGFVRFLTREYGTVVIGPQFLLWHQTKVAWAWIKQQFCRLIGLKLTERGMIYKPTLKIALASGDKAVVARVLVDTSTNRSYISERVLSHLGGDTVPRDAHDRVSLRMRSLQNDNVQFDVKLKVEKRVHCDYFPTADSALRQKILAEHGITLTDDTDEAQVYGSVDMVIGSDLITTTIYMPSDQSNTIKLDSSNLTLWQTRMGYTLSGTSAAPTERKNFHSVYLNHSRVTNYLTHRWCIFTIPFIWYIWANILAWEMLQLIDFSYCTHMFSLDKAAQLAAKVAEERSCKLLNRTIVNWNSPIPF